MVDDDVPSRAEATPMEEVEPTPEAPSVGEQKAQIMAIMEQKAFLELGDVYYPINFRWWDTWRRYVGVDEEEGACFFTEDLHPGGMDNSGLRGDSEVEIDKAKLCDQDYALLPERAYQLLKRWYGGPGPDFPRRVIEVGNQKEVKVEVFPYFLYYSWADSLALRGTERMQTGVAPLMAESTMEAEEAVKRMCVAAGLDPELMTLYVVAEDRGEGDEGKFEPIDMHTYTTRTLGDIFFGQHRVQLFVVDKRWRYRLKQDDGIDAQDTDKAWYDSKVVSVTKSDPDRGTLSVMVHFKCWESKWDESMDVLSEKIEPPFSRTENWRVKMAEGYELEVKGPGSKWYKGTITEVDQVGRRVRVSSAELQSIPVWKEWESEEICRSGVHIKPSTGAMLSFQSVKRTSSSTALVPSTRTSPSSSSHQLGSPTGAMGNRYSSPYGNGSANGYGYGRLSSRGTPPEAGAVGLSNLGNTCFMNSMLQCLSNTDVLTTFFLQGRYEDEINERNPLGMKGQLARVYAKLMKDMWSGDFTTVSPTDFKRVISNFAPQFAGYQQHDSQELMNFLLDGLHEDLNRVRNKPYVEMKDFDNVPDELASAEAWHRHLLRNDSLVIDHCQGQLKSHVTCPKCGYNSVTFDPYMSLSLPLPVMNTVKVTFRYFPLPYGAMPFRAVAQLPSQGTARDLKAWILEHFFTQVVDTPSPSDPPPPPRAHLADSDSMAVDSHSTPTPLRASSPAPPVTPRQRMTQSATIALDLTDNYDKRVFGHIVDHDPISKLSKPQMDVHVYQLEFNPATDPEVTVLTVMFGKTRTTFGFPLNKAYERFGLPFRMAVKPTMTNRQVYLRVCGFVVQRLFRQEATLAEAERTLRIIYANTPGGTNEGDLSNDEEVFQIDPQRQALVVLFSQESFAEWVDKDWADRYTAHSSISRKDGGVPRKAIHVQDCLDKFTEREQLGVEDLWYCTKCKERLQAFKKMDVWSTPDVLILHLKRFSYVQSYYVTREKIEDLVSFPLEGLDLRPLIRGPVEPTAPPIYDLYAVSEHSGGLGGGHYTAVGKNFRNGKWYSFNDSYVSEITDESGLESHIVTSRAYVLFYRRRAGSLKWAGARPGLASGAPGGGAVKQEEGGIKAEGN